MTLDQIVAIGDLFSSKAPSPEHLYMHPPMALKGMTYGGISLFEGTEGNSPKVASMSVKGFEGSRRLAGFEDGAFSLTLHIGWDEHTFIENYDLAVEMVNRFVKVPLKELAS